MFLMLLLAVGPVLAIGLGLCANAGAAAPMSSDMVARPAAHATVRERDDRSDMDVPPLSVRLTRRLMTASSSRRRAAGHSPRGHLLPGPTTGRSRAPSRAPSSDDGWGIRVTYDPVRTDALHGLADPGVNRHA